MTYTHKQEAHPTSTRSHLRLSHFVLGKNGVGRVAKVSNRCARRHQFQQQFETLCSHFDPKQDDAGGISAGLVETADEPDPDRVGGLHKDDRDRLGRSFGCKRTSRALQSNDHRYLTANQLGDQRRESIVLTLRPEVLERHVPAFDVTGVTQASVKSRENLALACFGRC